MKFEVMQGETIGDIFWDLAPWIIYAPGYDLVCDIYVKNPTAIEQEYALMARLTRDGTLLSEEALPVSGYTWFKVDPGDFVELKGALSFDFTDAVLTVQLIEKTSGDVIDSVVTSLVAPAGAPETTWSTMMGFMMPVLMFGMLGMVIASAFRPKKEKEAPVRVREVERKLLPPGRGE